MIRHFRRLCLFALEKDLRQELDLLDSYAEENPKNYQIWYHRRAVVEKLQDPSRELAFTAAVRSLLRLSLLLCCGFAVA